MLSVWFLCNFYYFLHFSSLINYNEEGQITAHINVDTCPHHLVVGGCINQAFRNSQRNHCWQRSTVRIVYTENQKERAIYQHKSKQISPNLRFFGFHLPWLWVSWKVSKWFLHVWVPLWSMEDELCWWIIQNRTRKHTNGYHKILPLLAITSTWRVSLAPYFFTGYSSASWVQQINSIPIQWRSLPLLFLSFFPALSSLLLLLQEPSAGGCLHLSLVLLSEVSALHCCLFRRQALGSFFRDATKIKLNVIKLNPQSMKWWDCITVLRADLSALMDLHLTRGNSWSFQLSMKFNTHKNIYQLLCSYSAV